MRRIVIRKAKPNELAAIKSLAAKNSHSLGFVLRPALEIAIREKRLLVAKFDRRIVGFQEYYHRKRDGQTTLYHKCVDVEFRRLGIGTALVDAVVTECKLRGREYLLLKCPFDLPSNSFHSSYGFKLIKTERGKRRMLNVWRLDLY